MTNAADWDVLFILNRTSPAQLVAQLAKRVHAQRVLILSSHRYFKAERAELARHLGAEDVRYLSFADLLDDATLAGVDEETSVELSSAKGAADYVDRYQRAMIARKNRLLAEVISCDNTWSHAWCDHGLGLCPEAWAERGARSLRHRPRRWIRPLAALRRLARDWPALRRLRTSPTVKVFEDTPTRGSYAFLVSTRRIALAASAKSTDMTLRDALALPPPVFVATTIHDHPRTAHRLGLSVRVFSDGLLPSNYPRSYLDAYGDATFVTNDPFAERWFRACGRSCAPAPSFLATRPFVWPISPRPLRRVLVLLNHAGDWCALINRSDTDTLVEAVVELAALHPDIHFNIRPHPSMDHTSHEGIGARDRLQTVITDAHLSNLSFSRAGLDEDLRTTDLALSEYSATLLEVWRAGQLGLVVNLTGRRSFMQDYEELGFVAAHGREVLHRFFEHADQNVVDLAKRQTDAAQRYNALLSAKPRQ